MPCFVFRYVDGVMGELLFFDGMQLRPVRLPVDLEPASPRRCTWGPNRERSGICALMLCSHCGVPDELLGEVANALWREWVCKLSREEQTVPEWVVYQEVCRLTMRVMNDLNGN